jgi:membrane protein involved in colicin uptake
MSKNVPTAEEIAATTAKAKEKSEAVKAKNVADAAKAKEKAVADKAKVKAAADADKAKEKADKAKTKAAADATKAKEKVASDKAKADAKAERDANREPSAGGVIDRSKYNYETNKDIKTASGRPSVDNGDELAAALRGKSADETVELVSINGGVVNDNWTNLNAGLRRMSAGNVLRRLARRSEGVVIDTKKYHIAA